MKILKRKNEENVFLKWAAYVIAAYLLASWGVCGVVNPLHYIRNARMSEVQVQADESSEGYRIHLPEDLQHFGYLSFQVTDSADYIFSFEICGYTKNGEEETCSMRLHRGWNSLDLFGRGWENIYFRQIKGLHLGQVQLTEYEKLETEQMVYVTVSLLLLAVFWECVWWIKKKYAQ